MAVEVGFQITGLKELAKNRKKLSKTLEKGMLRTALNNAAKPVVQQVEDNIRAKGLVRTGDLANNIVATKAKVTKRGFGYITIGYNDDQFYGGFHEVGTSQVPAQPHLRPALEQQVDAVLEEFTKSINKSFQRQLKKVGK